MSQQLPFSNLKPDYARQPKQSLLTTMKGNTAQNMQENAAVKGPKP
jgi:hypothetical protein